MRAGVWLLCPLPFTDLWLQRERSEQLEEAPEVRNRAVWSPNPEKGLGVYLFMEDPFPRGLWGPDAGAWLGVAWGPLSPSAVSKSLSTLSSAAAVSKPLGPKVHTPADGIVPAVKHRTRALETDVASQRVSCNHFSETRADGLMVPMTFLAASRAILMLSVSSPGLSASGVICLPR